MLGNKNKEDIEIKEDKKVVNVGKEMHISIDNFLSNSKKVKQFNSLNEIAFKKMFLTEFKKDSKKNPYLKKVDEWEKLFQEWIGVKF